MLVILESNVLLSALIARGGTPGQIYLAWRNRRFELVTCPEQLNEMRNATRQEKLRQLLSPSEAGVLINQTHRAIVWHDPLPRLHNAADPTDSFLLNLAQASQAHYLVTGDKRAQLLDRITVGSTRIVTARHFCEHILAL